MALALSVLLYEIRLSVDLMNACVLGYDEYLIFPSLFKKPISEDRAARFLNWWLKRLCF